MSLENLNMVMEIAGEQSVERGADRVGSKINNLRMKVTGLSEKVGKLGGRMNFFMGALATVGMDVRGIGQQLGIISQKEAYQAKSVVGKIGQAITPLAAAYAGYAGLGKLGASLGSFFGPIGTAIGAFIGSVAGLILGSAVGQWLNDTVGSFLDASWNWFQREVLLGVFLTGRMTETDREAFKKGVPERRGRFVRPMAQPEAPGLSPRVRAATARALRERDDRLKRMKLADELVQTVADRDAMFRTEMDVFHRDKGDKVSLIELLKTKRGQELLAQHGFTMSGIMGPLQGLTIGTGMSAKLDPRVQNLVNDLIAEKVELHTMKLRNELNDKLRAYLEFEIQQRDDTFMLLNEYFGG